MRKESDGGVYL